jgi:hypothetical protein
MKYRTRSWFPALLSLLALGAFAAIPQVALAQVQVDGPTYSDGCMQTAFGTPVTNSNSLVCTANDIKLSNVTAFSPPTCVSGDFFDLTATFTTVVTANSRYDAAFFFRTDGGPNARGGVDIANETCSISQLNDGGDGLELDGDGCYDLNSGSYPLTFTIPNVLCSDTDGNGFLNLPYCTSWHSNQGTLCALGTPFTDAKPDTKSKCVCDDNFQVPVRVVPPSGNLVKVATQAVVTYQITVHNTGSKAATLSALSDSIYGDIDASAQNAAIQSTTCQNGTSIVANDVTPYSCSFTVLVSVPGSSSAVPNIVSGLLSNSDGSASVNGSTSVVVDLDYGIAGH